MLQPHTTTAGAGAVPDPAGVQWSPTTQPPEGLEGVAGSSPHYTAAQTSFDDFWWLRWDDIGQRRELVNLPPCAAVEVPGDEDSDVCTLLLRHTGFHSFTYDN
jgi:hypothetical protein